MSALASIRRALAEYRAEFGLSLTAVAIEFAVLAAACMLVAGGGWGFAVISP